MGNEAAQRKVDKYKAEAEANGYTFIPFAVETFGGWTAPAASFVTDMIKLAKQQHVWAPFEVVYGLQREIAIAIQRGNAAIVRECQQRAGNADSVHACV